MQWLNQHPQYIKNRFFIATDSYSGVLAPIIANNILDGNFLSYCESINFIIFFTWNFQIFVSLLAGNNAGLEPTINLIVMIYSSFRIDYVFSKMNSNSFVWTMQGVISGSPRMNGKEEQSYQIILAHKLGLISKSIFNVSSLYDLLN